MPSLTLSEQCWTYRHGLVSNPPEEMGAFFDARADDYDDHMRKVLDAPAFYGAIADAITPTDDAITILDLGCGTGLELAGIFARAPRARVTGIDLSPRMLELLRERHANRLRQLTLLQGSYLTLPLAPESFAYVVSAQTLHHLLPTDKRRLYARITTALQPRGVYVEGDYVVAPAEEMRLRTQYETREGDLIDGRYHLDIPCSVETQRALLRDAGFASVEVTYQAINCAVFVAAKP